jgi:hypothetical protein
MGEARESLKQCHDARVTEAEGGGALARLPGGTLYTIEGVLCQDALVTDAFDFEEFAIDLLSKVPKVRQVFEAFVDVEVRWIVDGRFSPERPFLFEVLLYV